MQKTVATFIQFFSSIFFFHLVFSSLPPQHAIMVSWPLVWNIHNLIIMLFHNFSSVWVKWLCRSGTEIVWSFLMVLYSVFSFVMLIFSEAVDRHVLRTADAKSMYVQSFCAGVSDWPVLRMTGQSHSFHQMALLIWWPTAWAHRYSKTPTNVIIALCNRLRWVGVQSSDDSYCIYSDHDFLGCIVQG